MLVLAIGFAFQAGISIVSLTRLRASLLAERTSEVKHLLETAYSTVAYYHDQASKGLMTDEAARQAAKSVVRSMRYDHDNYFFIWALDGTGVAHGSHPEWEGMNFLNPAVAAQKPLFADVAHMVTRLLAVSRSPQKEGVTSYRIPRLGGTVALDKIAYARLFEPWGWSIGTGAYVDDIDAVFWKEAVSILAVSIGLIALAGVLTILIGRSLARALNRLAARVASVAKGEFDGEVPEVARFDEVGVMARALLVLRDNSRDAVNLRLDHLTGLSNRKVLMDRLKQIMVASSRSGNYAGLMLIDLDRFKMLNDTQGHDAGDMLLREVAQRLLACVGEGDTVARLGGDEFVVVVADIAQEEKHAADVLEATAERILGALNEVYHLGSVVHACTASVGLTLFKGSLASAADLLKQADLALYKSKGAGRNTCRFFDPVMETTVRERAALERDLRQAIEKKRFHLHFQPQVGITGRLTGAEALLRWNDPERGSVSPAEFMPLAETTGLIRPLGEWVLETACTQLAIWRTRPELSHLTIGVNVSVRQFQLSNFVEHLLGTLRRTGADPTRLELELTESTLVENIDDVVEKMCALKSIGVSFALDDFGTGYSSLAYLKSLPLDRLKIDRSFVRDLLTDPDDAAIVATIVGLARTLGLGVIAEGVETAEQRDFLSSIGCHSYQGYFLSWPLSLESFEQLAYRSFHHLPALAAEASWVSPGSVRMPNKLPGSVDCGAGAATTAAPCDVDPSLRAGIASTARRGRLGATVSADEAAVAELS